jgi:hypothetical protein
LKQAKNKKSEEKKSNVKKQNVNNKRKKKEIILEPLPYSLNHTNPTTKSGKILALSYGRPYDQDNCLGLWADEMEEEDELEEMPLSALTAHKSSCGQRDEPKAKKRKKQEGDAVTVMEEALHRRSRRSRRLTEYPHMVRMDNTDGMGQGDYSTCADKDYTADMDHDHESDASDDDDSDDESDEARDDGFM